MDSVSALFTDLEDTLVQGSFGLLVNTTLSPIAISQSVVEKIYPSRTGMEETRVTYQTSDGSIVDDRRNQTYLVSDTLHQGLIQNVPSANWTALAEEVQKVPRGDRGHMILNITLTGTTEAVPYYVMFDRWEFVSDWVLLVLAPVEKVDDAIAVQFEAKEFRREARAGDDVRGSMTLSNRGSIDVTVAPSSWPAWLEFDKEITTYTGTPLSLKSGASIEIKFVLKSDNLAVGTSVSTVSFRVVDDGYPDCFYDHYTTFDAVLKVNPVGIDENLIGKWVIAGYSMFAIVFLTAGGLIVWTGRNWHSRVVRCSQPKFLVMLCVGTIMMSMAFITLSFDDENSSQETADQACMATPWLLSMGFIIAFSALFSKIWRINKIFHNPRFKRITVTEQDVLVPFAILFAINFALLLAWTLIDPLRYVRSQVNEGDPFSDTYGSCKFENNSTIAFGAAVLAVNFCAVVLACAQAYRAREISDEFSESKWVAITVASWLQVFVVGFPVMLLVEENPMATYLLRVCILFVICMSLLLFLFVPKIVFRPASRTPESSFSPYSPYSNSKAFASAKQQPSEQPNSDSVITSRQSTTSKTNGVEDNMLSSSPSVSEDQTSSHGFGMKIIRQPAYSTTEKTNQEEMLEEKVRQLEESVEKLKHQNNIMRVLMKKSGGTSTTEHHNINESQRLGLMSQPTLSEVDSNAKESGNPGDAEPVSTEEKLQDTTAS